MMQNGTAERGVEGTTLQFELHRILNFKNNAGIRTFLSHPFLRAPEQLRRQIGGSQFPHMPGDAMREITCAATNLQDGGILSHAPQRAEQFRPPGCADLARRSLPAPDLV